MRAALAILVILAVAALVVLPLVLLLRALRRRIDAGWRELAGRRDLSFDARSREISGSIDGRSLRILLVTTVTRLVGSAGQRGKGDHTRLELGLEGDAVELEQRLADLRGERAMWIDGGRLVWDVAGICASADRLEAQLNELLAAATALESDSGAPP